MANNRRNANKRKKNKGKNGAGQQTRVVERVVYRDRPAPPKPKNSFLGDLGALAGNGLSKFLGLGAYKVAKNSVYETITKGQVPFMHSSSETIIFRHREYITDINATQDFAITSFALNPGLKGTFPFLGSIAQNFQQYELRGIVFEYRSTCGLAVSSGNTAMGSVIMAAQYDVNDAEFTDKTSMLNEMWSASAKPSENFILPIECDPKVNPIPRLYVRGAAVTTGDYRLYDHARISVATYGSQEDFVAGELWATYEVVLYKPTMTSFDDQYDQAASYNLPGGIDASIPLANPTLVYDSIGLEFTPTTITVPRGLKGNFIMTYVATGNSTSTVSPSVTISGGGEYWAVYRGAHYLTNGGTTTTQYILNIAFKVVNPQVTTILTFSGGTLPAVTTSGSVMLVQVDGSLPPA